MVKAQFDRLRGEPLEDLTTLPPPLGAKGDVATLRREGGDIAPTEAYQLGAWISIWGLGLGFWGLDKVFRGLDKVF